MTPPRSVLVTGAARGFGYELCRLYLQRGWRVFPLVRAPAGAAPLARTAPERCHPIVADVRDDDVAAKIDAVTSKHTDRLELLINNAGVSGRTRRIEEVTSAEVLELLQVHCLGAIRCTKAVLPLLRAARGAQIVNVSSRVASMARNAAGEFSGERFSYAYRLAKAAQNMFTLCLGQELAPEGIAVFAVHPGGLRTAMATPEADTDPADAALWLADWLETADLSMSGQFIDLGKGTMPW